MKEPNHNHCDTGASRSGGMSEARFSQDLPALKPEHIRAGLAFACPRMPKTGCHAGRKMKSDPRAIPAPCSPSVARRVRGYR